MPTGTLNFLFDVNNPSRSSLITSPLETSTYSVLNQVRDDRSLAVTITPVTSNPPGSRSLYSPDWVNTDTFQLAIGLADGTASGGTFGLSVNGVTTALTALSYNIPSATLQTPLSAAFIANSKPGCTVQLLAAGVYRITGTSVGSITTGYLTTDPTLLDPTCDVFVEEDSLGSGSSVYDLRIIIRTAPFAYAEPAAPLPATGVSVATTQAGSSTTNQIQTISFTVPQTYSGTFSVALLAGNQIEIGDNTISNPTQVNCFQPHGFKVGDTVVIAHNNGSIPTIAGTWTVVSIGGATPNNGPTWFTIAVNCTTAGTSGYVERDISATCGVAWPEMTAEQFAQLLANHPAVNYQDTTGLPNNVEVTKPGETFVVNFLGTLGNSSTPSITVTNIDLIGPQGVSGTIDLNTDNLYEYSLTTGAQIFDLLLSITRTRASGEVRTIFGPTTVGISKDIVDPNTRVPVPAASYYTSVQSDARFAKIALDNTFTGNNEFTTGVSHSFLIDGTGNVTIGNSGSVNIGGNAALNIFPTGPVNFASGTTGVFFDASFPVQVDGILKGGFQTNTIGTGTVTVATTAFVDITGMSAAIGASQTWIYHAQIPITGATNGCKFRVTGPASPTSVQINVRGPSAGATSLTSDNITSFSTGTSNGYFSSSFTSFVDIDIVVANGTNAGTVSIQFATATGTNTITALAGRWIEGTRK